MYFRKLAHNLVLRTAVNADARIMGELQRRVFPTLSAAELLTEKHFAAHIERFPEGQLVVDFNGRVIGSTSTFRCRYPAADHNFLDVTGNLWLTTHDPEGEWLYGIDMGVEPSLQGLGLGRFLYAARHQVVRDLKMAGQVIVGMPSGYGKVSSKVSFDDYYAQLLSGEVFDPTVSMQMKMGFEPSVVIADYLLDPKCGNYGVMMQLPVAREISPPKIASDEIALRIGQIFSELPIGLAREIEISRGDEGAYPESSLPANTPAVKASQAGESTN